MLGQVCQNKGNKIHHDAVKKTFTALPLLFVPVLLLLLSLLPVTTSMAMSLGRHSGVVLIGRPLDLSVQAVLDAQDDASSLCLEADVFYADNKLDKSRVRVTLEKSASSPLQAIVRIRSSVLVDEPVVTFNLRMGCQLKSERRYVSLADLVPEPAPDRSAMAEIPSAVPARPVANSPGSTSTVRGLPAPPPRARATAPKPDAARAPAVNQAASIPQPAKARLKLEPLDLSIDRDPQLKASAQLLSTPATSPQERAAASALYRALTAQPQDILRDIEKLQSLEKSVRSMQAQSQNSLTTIADLNTKLEQAQAGQYANPLVYGLIFLLLAALAGLAFLLRRKNAIQVDKAEDKPWWRKNEATKNRQQAWRASAPAHELYESSAAKFAAEKKPDSVDIPVDFTLNPAAKTTGARPPGTPGFENSAAFEARNNKSAFGADLLRPGRAVKAEELFDVQQQADFFVSIGQRQQAIELLRSHIAENSDPSALVYLDLFDLYHQLQQPVEYDALRASFNERFNTEIPTFEAYADKNDGLEAYQQALSRIEALWPTPKVLEVIEDSLFKKPDAKAEAFNLEAYRELLTLYAVAKEIIGSESAAQTAVKKIEPPVGRAGKSYSQSTPFESTAIQPLTASVQANPLNRDDLNTEPLMAFVIPPASSRLGLDIDLGDLTFAPDRTAALLPPSGVNEIFKARTDTPDDLDTFGALPILDGVPPPSISTTASTDNLIDFDFSDAPPVASKIVKPVNPTNPTNRTNPAKSAKG